MWGASPAALTGLVPSLPQPEEVAQEAAEEPLIEPLMEPEGESYEEPPQVRGGRAGWGFGHPRGLLPFPAGERQVPGRVGLG